MKKLRAWFTVGSFAFLGSLAAVSCGSDEATGENNGGGTLDGGGSGGMEGGVIRDGDSAVPTGEIGRACVTDAECGDGLTCVPRDDVDTLGGAPPNGLCTVACENDDVCLEYSQNAWCVGFDNGNYCLEGCEVDSGLGVKCHDRADFLCTPVDSAALGVSCTTDAQCDPGTVCLSGECTALLMICLPRCGSNEDCASGLFCDPLLGMCVEDEPTGKGYNEVCDPAGDPAECASGICFEDYDDPSTGTCSGRCNFGNPYACGYTGEGKADTACLFASVVGGQQEEAGDLGYCGQLCDCDDECTATGEVCRPIENATLEEFWQRVGYCVPIVEGGDFTADDSLGPCAGGAPNAGGAGGAPSTGGAPPQGGSPAESGAGGAPAGAGGG